MPHEDLPSDYMQVVNEPNKMHDMPPVDGKGLRYSKGKLRYDLFPPEALEEIVRVYTRGAEKYTTIWQNGIEGLWQSVPNVKRLDLYLAGTCVVTVMKSGSEIKIAGRRIANNSTKLAKFGLTTESYKLRCEKGCDICGRTTNLHIDHDHETEKFRGILCCICNNGLGFLGDNVSGLERALAYLKSV